MFWPGSQYLGQVSSVPSRQQCMRIESPDGLSIPGLVTVCLESRH